ncbi:SseB family protein [Rothia sp. ZJ1223]|uniref:SseB family protein n=1 Tax=Rothia sp. ZJ1223 TaxID=2811098 RepID=UPI00195B2499|nr:SseB family protein [Rothia sp. ZJ1223]MBM7051908.1 SseB family protein [Rothia sp. ZJ1223]
MNPRFAVSERERHLQDSLNAVGSWMLANCAETEWNKLVLEVKPAGESFFTRLTRSFEDRDIPGQSQLLDEEDFITEELHRLQHAAYDEHEGSWFSATIIVAAKGWPSPSFQVGAAYNRAGEPSNWEGEGGISNRDIRVHLEKFPRTSPHPAWVDLRLKKSRSVPIADLDEQKVPNSYLVEALREFGAERTERALVNVARQMLSGDVFLDATDSEFVPEGDNPWGPETRGVYSVIRLANYRALCVFSSADTALASHREKGREGTPVLTREASMKVFLDVLSREDLNMLVIDPGTAHMCIIEEPQIQWLLQVPSNAAAKNALMKQNMQALLSALAAPSAFLLTAVAPDNLEGTPLMVEEEDGRALLTFTSAAEASALDPTLEVRSAQATDILEFAVASGADYVKVNALNPTATLPIAQVRDLIDLIQAARITDSQK